MTNLSKFKLNPNHLSQNSLQLIDKAITSLEIEKHIFCLYIAGDTPKSRQAIQNIVRICEEYLPGCYELEVIDICQRPEVLEEEHILAVPTLIRKFPLPLQKLIGEMTNIEKIVFALGI